MGIFRASALARYQSPEQLDQLMTAAPPRSWLGLWAMIALVALGATWGVLGTIRTSVTGQGLIIRPGGVFTIDSLGAGKVTQVLVQPGAKVKKGQLVATIAQPTLELEVATTRAELAQLTADHAALKALYDGGDTLYASQVAAQREGLARTEEFLKRRQEATAELAALNRKAIEEHQRQLLFTRKSLDQRLALSRSTTAKLEAMKLARAVAARELETAIEERETREERVRQTQTELARLEVTRTQTESGARRDADQIEESLQALANQRAALAKEEAERTTRRREDLFARAQAVHALRTKLDLLVSRLELLSTVKSTYDGVVVEVMAAPGKVIAVGQPIASGELLERQLEVALFVPAREGKKVQPGMRIEITPSTVKREEVGYMLGRVRAVIAYPASDDAMLKLIPNRDIVNELRNGGVCVQIVGDLIEDAGAPSGFRWSSGRGPDLSVHSGTLVACSITVREQAPVTLVIPSLRKAAGVY